MRSTIKSQLLGNRADLELERKGLISPRATERQLAALRRPAKAPVTAPVAITTDVKSGAALSDVLDTLHDAGVIDNQSRVGTDKIVPLSDAAASLDTLTTTGIVVRTGPGSFVTRDIFSNELNGLKVTNADGVKGRVILTVDPMLAALTEVGLNALATGAGMIVYDPVSGNANTAQIAPGFGIAVTTDTAGIPTIALDFTKPAILSRSAVRSDGVDPTTTNNSTYASGIDLSFFLPAGTWTAEVDTSANFRRGVAGSVDFEIWVAGVEITASYLPVDAQVTYYTTGRTVATVTGLPGSNTTHFESRYKNTSGGNTVTCKNPTIRVVLTRTA